MSRVSCPVAYWSHRTPDEIAVMDKSPITYRQLNAEIRAVQEQLDYPEGAVIYKDASSEFRFVVYLFALWRQGLVCCPINPGLSPSLREDTILKHGAHPLKLSIHTKQISEEISLETPCLQLMTSGTTSTPKIAVFSFENLWINAKTANYALGLTEADRWVASLPRFHIGGISIFLRSFIAGATVSLLQEDELATIFSLVPTQLFRKISQKNLPRKARKILIGGAPISLALYSEAKSLELPVSLTYGLTEASSQVLISNNPIVVGSDLYLGSPIAPQQLMLSKENEILMKGPTLFLGYKSKEGLQLPLNKNQWFATNDLGGYHPDHGYCIKGRKDRMVISGGENIQPEEVVRALYDCWSVKLAFVTSVPDPEYGNKLVAFVSTKLSDDELKAQLKTQLPGYKIPKAFFRLEDIPEINGKPSDELLQKLALRHLGITALR